jgi:exopolyphosphatase/guanosine-5'-triphosphate,3'-diphosphate pyrophosphatase
MRVAVVDLGTNTFNLLIADAHGTFFSKVHSEKIPVRLGEGGINKGVIVEDAYLRGLEAMEHYASECRQFEVERIIAFATSAVRNAANGTQFTVDVKMRTGIEIQIIDGAKEAEYIYKGVRAALNFREERSLIIDIGGGSTEFIIADKDGLLWKRSFEIGASRLLQRFQPSDPIRQDEIYEIEQYLDETLNPMYQAARELQVTELIGASGSFESLAEMLFAEHDPNRTIEESTSFEFDLAQCAAIHEKLLQSTRAQRLQIKGLVAMRVDMIVVSAILVELVIRRLELPAMRMSSYALKEGALTDLLIA